MVKTLLNVHDYGPDDVQAGMFGGRRGGLGDHKICLLISKSLGLPRSKLDELFPTDFKK